MPHSVCCAGKCSHGGDTDLTSTRRPRGGISKDRPHGDKRYYYEAAVKVATAASLQLLEDIRLAVQDEDFLRLAFSFCFRLFVTFVPNLFFWWLEDKKY